MDSSGLKPQKNFVPRYSAWRASRPKIASLGQGILEDFSKTLSTLEPSLQRKFLPLLGSLKQEKDSDFLLQGLFQIGIRLKLEGCETAALSFFARLAQNDMPEEIRRGAGKEAAALTGSGGSWAMRAEYLFSGLAQPETVFKGVLPMLGTTLVGQLVGTAVLTGLGRAAWTGWAGFLTKGVGRRLGAGLVSLAVETPVLLGLNQVVSPGQGSLGESWLPTALSLGLMRVCMGAGHRMAGISPVLGTLVPQGAMLGSLYAVNKMEAKRMGIEDGTTGTDTVFNFFHLLLGDRLGRSVLGLGRFQAELAMRAASNGNTGMRQIYLPAGRQVTATTDLAIWKPQAAIKGNISRRELSRSPSNGDTLRDSLWSIKNQEPNSLGISSPKAALEVLLEGALFTETQKVIGARSLSFMIASGMACLGCCDGQNPGRSGSIFLTSIVAAGLTWYLLSARATRSQKRLISQFHALERKSVQDLIDVTKATTRHSLRDIEIALHTALHYGAPPKGVRLDNARVLKSIAVDILRLPPIKRRGGVPFTVFHVVPDQQNLDASFSSIRGMPLAYADRIRSWIMKNLPIDPQRAATSEQREKREEILALKIHQKFGLPAPQAWHLVQSILREPPTEPAKQGGQLFDNEFPLLFDLDGYDFHLRVGQQPAHCMLSQAGYSKDTEKMLWLKEVISCLCAECRVPVPSYSMLPNSFYPSDRPDAEIEHRTNFTDHDWQAVYRLRDAVWGPWRLPWEELQASPH